MNRAKLVVLGVVVLSIGTIAAAGIPHPANVAIRTTVARDQSTWTMPLDGYVIPSFEKLDYAEDLLIGKCLAGKPGNDYVVPWRDVDAAVARFDAQDAARSGNDSPPLTSTRPLDPATAATRGYQGPSRIDPGRSVWQAWSPKVVDADFGACAQSARKQLDDARADSGEQQTASFAALRLTAIAAQLAQHDGSVVAAAREWKTCMVGANASVVTDTPADMRAAVRARFGIVTGASVGADERKLAETDLGCQQRSGYRTTLYDAEWNRLTRVTAQDADALHMGTPTMAAIDARATRVIAELAPARP